MNTIYKTAVAVGIFGCVALGIQAKPIENTICAETTLVLKMMEQNHAEIKAELKEFKAEINKRFDEVNKRMDAIEKKVDTIGFYFDMFQYIFIAIVSGLVMSIPVFFRQEIKNFIINLFSPIKNINTMKTKSITNTMNITIATAFCISLLCGTLSANAQTYRDRDSDGLIEISTINQLDSIRYNLTGTCSIGTCNGYELTRSLDFNSPSSYRDTTGKLAPLPKKQEMDGILLEILLMYILMLPLRDMDTL